MTTPKITQPLSPVTALVGNLRNAFTTLVIELNTRIDEHALPRQHRMGTWETMRWSGGRDIKSPWDKVTCARVSDENRTS